MKLFVRLLLLAIIPLLGCGQNEEMAQHENFATPVSPAAKMAVSLTSTQSCSHGGVIIPIEYPSIAWESIEYDPRHPYWQDYVTGIYTAMYTLYSQNSEVLSSALRFRILNAKKTVDGQLIGSEYVEPTVDQLGTVVFYNPEAFCNSQLTGEAAFSVAGPADADSGTVDPNSALYQVFHELGHVQYNQLSSNEKEAWKLIYNQVKEDGTGPNHPWTVDGEPANYFDKDELEGFAVSFGAHYTGVALDASITNFINGLNSPA